MTSDQQYMCRCLEIAEKGSRAAAPNPSVGAVLVHNHRIIGEGHTQAYGGAHAEPTALANVHPKDRKLLKEATLYVTLEPCSHYGKTPPCADLVIKQQIKRVVIGCTDPNPLVAGRGIRRLQEADCEVVVGILREDCEWHHRRFIHSIKTKQPYVILKWAETKDGFFAPLEGQKWISNPLTKRITHRWRSEEQAILVGTNTAKIDNPKLTVRHWYGQHPTRLIIDKKLTLSPALHLFDGKHPSIIFTQKTAFPTQIAPNISYQNLDFSQNILPQILDFLYQKNIQSVLVEGGAQLLNSFIQSNLWNEARIFIGNQYWQKGIPAPQIKQAQLFSEESIGNNTLKVMLKQIEDLTSNN